MQGNGKQVKHNMGETDTRLDALLKLAQTRSGTDRTLLYRHVAHLLMQNGNSPKGGSTRILFELFDALSDQVDVETRAEFASDLAKSDHAPPALLHRLAKDDINVAAPILRGSDFSETALLAIIKATTRAHHLVIAERRDLTQKLWQAIVERRDTAPAGPPAPPKPTAKAPTPDQPAYEEPAHEEPAYEEPADSLIPFKNRVRGKADIFVAQNDTEPTRKGDSAPQSDFGDSADTIGIALKDEPIPAFFLEKPRRKPDAYIQPGRIIAPDDAFMGRHSGDAKLPRVGPQKADAIKEAKWSTNRAANLRHVSAEMATLFGSSVQDLNGTNLLELLQGKTNDDDALEETMRRHLPLRDIQIRLADGTAHLIGRARFEQITGRFLGYKGTISSAAKPPSPEHKADLSEHSIPLAPRRTAQPKADPPIERHPHSMPNSRAAKPSSSTGHVLAAHLSADATLPIQDMLAGIQRIARSAKRSNDQALLTDIRAVMADCFKLRDMIQDADRIARMFGGNGGLEAQNFDVFKVINAVLDDDLTRHDGLARFHLNPEADFTDVRFSRSVLAQALSRMMELARESAGHGDLLSLDVLGGENHLEIRLPLGAASNQRISDAELLEPDDQLTLASMRRNNMGTPVMTARLGLSALQETLESLDGRLEINLLPGMSGGRISLFLPLT